MEHYTPLKTDWTAGMAVILILPTGTMAAILTLPTGTMAAILTLPTGTMAAILIHPIGTIHIFVFTLSNSYNCKNNDN